MILRIEVKVIGTAELFNCLVDGARFSRECADLCATRKVEWNINLHAGEVTLDDFLFRGEEPVVIVVESGDFAAMSRLPSLQPGARRSRAPTVGGALTFPIIAVCDSWSAAAEAFRRAPAITDCAVGPINCDEILNRALVAIGRRIVQNKRRDFGLVQIIPDCRMLVSGGSSLLLSEFEFNLAEFFLSTAGTTVSIGQLIEFFRAAGRSAQRNNLRVAIFSLRSKLEGLTKSRLRVVSVYRQGYSLRLSRNEISAR